ncbi:MAG: hypothetical protein D6729_00780 [Deltaproteobacteria bacterium]|nr:MAG: hypothetical protein D6729_00780 [Deltaproteobacteria bacterium]
MAAKIRDELGVEVELRPGGRGVFDVRADGELIFSKDAAGRFPDEESEVLAPLRERLR